MNVKFSKQTFGYLCETTSFLTDWAWRCEEIFSRQQAKVSGDPRWRLRPRSTKESFSGQFRSESSQNRTMHVWDFVPVSKRKTNRKPVVVNVSIGRSKAYLTAGSQNLIQFNSVWGILSRGIQGAVQGWGRPPSTRSDCTGELRRLSSSSARNGKMNNKQDCSSSGSGFRLTAQTQVTNELQHWSLQLVQGKIFYMAAPNLGLRDSLEDPRWNSRKILPRRRERRSAGRLGRSLDWCGAAASRSRRQVRRVRSGARSAGVNATFTLISFN